MIGSGLAGIEVVAVAVAVGVVEVVVVVIVVVVVVIVVGAFVLDIGHVGFVVNSIGAFALVDTRIRCDGSHSGCFDGCLNGCLSVCQRGRCSVAI